MRFFNYEFFGCIKNEQVVNGNCVNPFLCYAHRFSCRYPNGCTNRWNTAWAIWALAQSKVSSMPYKYTYTIVVQCILCFCIMLIKPCQKISTIIVNKSILTIAQFLFVGKLLKFSLKLKI